MTPPLSDRAGRDPSGSAGWQEVDAGDPRAFLDYLAKVSAQDWAKRLKQQSFALMDIRPGARVLDVGCGRGDDVIALLDLVGPSGAAAGVDSSDAMLDVARQKAVALPNASFHRADAHTLPFDEGSFDACRIERTLEHVRDPQKVLSEMKRVSRPGARIVAGEPDWDTVTVSVDDLDLANRLIHYHTKTFAHGAIGRQLHGLYSSLGLVELVVDAAVVHFTDIEVADQVLKVRGYGRIAADAGVVTRDEATRWEEQVASAAHEGRFFASVCAFTVSGRKR